MKTEKTSDAAPMPAVENKVSPAAATPAVAPPPVAVPSLKGGASPAEEDKPPEKNFSLKKVLIGGGIPVVLVAAGVFAYVKLHKTGYGEGFVSGNGRIEATEIDVATKLAARVDNILVVEGDFVEKGQLVAKMLTPVLEAQRDEARAQYQKTITVVAAASAQVAGRESDKVAAQSLVTQRESELDATQRRLVRSETLSAKGVTTLQGLDDDRANERSAQAATKAANAQVTAAQAAIDAAIAEVMSARASVTAAMASTASIEADIADSQLKSPRAGRVQYRVAEPGEMLAAGATVLNIIDLSDVYMTFFLPEQAVGKVGLGSDVRIVLDARKEYVIPAKVSFVASAAQFTPKTVETASERQKLMFRVKARIDPKLLTKHLKMVKTGLPGVAWLKLDAKADWPPELAVNEPQ